jgi:alpha-beta hydrolase superfamily lysophospholipase
VGRVTQTGILPYSLYLEIKSSDAVSMQRMPRILKRIALSVLRILFVSYLLILAGLYFFQEKLIFIPEKLDANYKYEFSGHFSERWIQAGSTKLDSVLFKVPEPKGVILYLHGNAGTMAFWGEVASQLSEKTNWDVWMIDFPGFGKSEGTITSEKQLHEMAESFWSEADKEYPNSFKVIYGRSLGTGLAVKLASDHKGTGLVLESPYFSLADVVTGIYPWVPLALLRYSIHSDEWIKNVTGPILAFHGTRDEVIAFNGGKRLSALVPQATFVEIPGGHHNDIGRSPLYWKVLEHWLSDDLKSDFAKNSQ